MDDNACVGKLIELIFIKKFEVTEEMSKPNSSFSTCLLKSDFIEKLRKVLLVRCSLAQMKFEDFLSNIDEFVVNPELYLMRTFGICLKEHKSQQNVFDSFISVCSLVRVTSYEFHRDIGINVWDLNYAIVMEFYDTVLKKIFLRRGGFRRLVEYINHNKYLSWSMEEMYNGYLDLPSTSTPTYTIKKLKREINGEMKALRMLKINERELAETVRTMVKNVLLTTAIKLSSPPPYPRSSENSKLFRETNKTKTTHVEERTEATVKFETNKTKTTHVEERTEAAVKFETNKTKTTRVEERTEATVKFEFTDGDQKYSKKKCVLKPIKDNQEYESIDQSVKRNNLESSDFDYCDNSVLSKATNILEHLKNAIQSLIKVLDEYDEE